MTRTNETLLTLLSKEMVIIPSGKIDLRDDRIKKQWSVEITSFKLAKFPVTQELYFQITGKNPSAFKGGNLPVETVSWKEATGFCNSISVQTGLTPCYSFGKNEEEILFDQNVSGFRLPAEAEWEYACKAGTSGVLYGELDDIAWYKKNSEQTTHPVGKKTPNVFGVCDMLGNVWEWCNDLYDTNVYGTYRIFRGGGWNDEERSVMATNRRRSHPNFKIDDLGFRIARNIHG